MSQQAIDLSEPAPALPPDFPIQQLPFALPGRVIELCRNLALTPEQAAEVLQVSRTTAYEMVRRGEMRRFKIGAQVRIPTRDVLALLALTRCDLFPAEAGSDV